MLCRILKFVNLIITLTQSKIKYVINFNKNKYILKKNKNIPFLLFIYNSYDQVHSKKSFLYYVQENITYILVIAYPPRIINYLPDFRLATKYLDKELAGRIQQLQLLGRDMRAEVRDSLWAQVLQLLYH